MVRRSARPAAADLRRCGRGRAALGAKRARLLLPVEDERARHHDQRRQAPAAARAALARRGAPAPCTVLPSPMSSARQPPKPKRREEMEPAEALSLVAAQAAGEAGGLAAGLIPSNLVSSARAFEERVDSRLRKADRARPAIQPGRDRSADDRRRAYSTAASTPYRFSHSSGRIPKVPSSEPGPPPSPRRSAASSSGRRATRSPNSTLPWRSNQSTPELTSIWMAPGRRYSLRRPRRASRPARAGRPHVEGCAVPARAPSDSLRGPRTIAVASRAQRGDRRPPAPPRRA